MNFIFKSQFLDFQPRNKNTNFQYHHWAEKKRVEKEKGEYEQFRKMWFEIQEEEEKDKQKNKAKSIKHPEKKTAVKPEELYHKNLQWKQGVQSKLQKKRQQKRQEKQKEYQQMKQSKFKQPKLLKDFEHKGPIKAWHERFNNYLRAKGGPEYNENTQNEFHPQIDKNSRRITKQMVGKVEDRLIEYGQKLKEKKIEMEIIYQQQLHAQRNLTNNQSSFESAISDVYWRLYKDGERINQKRNEQKSEYSFTPEINQYSQEIASRISQKRTPLYQSKLIQSKVVPEQKSVSKNKKASEKGFNDFLKRNEALLSKIEKNRLKKFEIIRQKQNKQFEQCTFAPEINPKSLKIFANYNTPNGDSRQKIQNLSKIQSNQIEYESQQKKLTMVKSQNDQLNNSSGKRAHSTQRIQRLHSDGNFNAFSEPSNLFIDDQDSISNLHQSKKLPQIHQSPLSIKKGFNSKNRSNQSDFLVTDRHNEKAPIYNIHEEIEEDSIEKERDNDWQKELNLMQLQIQAMMARTN